MFAGWAVRRRPEIESDCPGFAIYSFLLHISKTFNRQTLNHGGNT
jgi:hypothetical protein